MSTSHNLFIPTERACHGHNGNNWITPGGGAA
ncbi:hypothetical protein PMI35_04613 [Pseudomonas sp. GM78]|nr:hypothetical protein PMI35_04613 [Pseudomonas sp. GM78]